MRNLLSLTLLILLFNLRSTAQTTNPNASRDAKISLALQQELDHGQPVDLLILFRDKADVSGAYQLKGKAAKGQYVYTKLIATAEKSQANARRLLRERQVYTNSFYLVNAIAVRGADAGLVQDLARLPEVAALTTDPEITFQEPVYTSTLPAERGAIEWGIEKINAPAVWALGYTGQGITVAGADTGYEWYHPALKPHYRGYNNQDGSVDHNHNWHDAIHEISPLSGDSIPDPANNPCGVDATAPCDDHNHGTHTMGTMVGDDGQGNQIGVAPGADWIACRNMERGNGKPSSYIECLEWFIAPTDLNGQNADPAKAPHVINNSWYCSVGEGCTDLTVDEMLRQTVINLRAAGVVVVVSNGNFGGSGCNSTWAPPAYFEESFSVGATESNDTITGFSSRGPVTIDGSGRLKPNVVAPGAGVRSSIRNDGYAHFWGTSMAGPHVAGLVALVLSARPDLAGEVETIETIIEETAIPKFDTVDCGGVSGQAYPNNTYGYGRVDALAAVNKALSISATTTPDRFPVLAEIFPNPTSALSFMRITNLLAPAQLELYNTGGQLVFRQMVSSAPVQQLRLDLTGYPQGLYIWKLQTNSGLLSGKLIRQ
ncbi:MAG: T9SS type A sorting domain-containing protein [Bacteroidetes bacterium]|nr:MAG: T9SS type A sorting domain-containing protein [Bacteroidota bacterium]